MGFEEQSKILPIGKSLFTQRNGHLPKVQFIKKRTLYLLLFVRRFPVDNSNPTPYILCKHLWITRPYPVDNLGIPVDNSH